MSTLAPSYAILWASQTGNAEWIAKNIHSEATRRGYTGSCNVMDDYTEAKLDETKVIIFVTSNTGDGDPPDNALKFWRFFRRQKQADYLAHAQITLLGLGDTNYSNFNNTAKRIEKKATSIGATVFYEKGLADDAEGLESIVDPWIAGLWDALPSVLQKTVDTATVANEADPIETVTDGVEALTVTSSEPSPNAPLDPYSLKSRKHDLPDPVRPYLDLPGTLVEIYKGHVLEIDTAGLQAGVKLTGLPRMPEKLVHLVRVGTAPGTETPTTVPDFASPHPWHMSPVTAVRCLTTNDAVKRTLELEIDVDDMHYEPGDAVSVMAPNDPALVKAVLDTLLPAEEAYETLYRAEGTDLPSHLAKVDGVTLDTLLRYGVDLNSAPRKALIRTLADYASQTEKDTLMYLCSKQGTAAFNALRDQSPTLLDLLVTFSTCKPPVERLLDVLPPLQPRHYSVANSPMSLANKMRVAFNVVQYTTHLGVERKGVATPWLDTLSGRVPFRVQDASAEWTPVSHVSIPIALRHNTNHFLLPQDTQRPLILIGPGTGIAPFVGFVQHRQAQRKIRQSMGGIVGASPADHVWKDFGDIIVYTGCRDRTRDFLFQEELEALVTDRTIKRLEVAESRATDTKVYVQDLIRRDARELYDLVIQQDARIYVCGDTKGMAKGVHDVLADMLCEYGGLDTVSAIKTLAEWIQHKKYLRDLW